MRVIHKAELPIGNNLVIQDFPTNCLFLSCGFQGNRLVVRYKTDTNILSVEERYFYLFKTGEGMPINPEEHDFIGTAQDISDPTMPFVIHLFVIL